MQAIEAADPAAAGKYTRILDAALALFQRYGVRRTSIEDVAQEAGVAKGTVYLYFESKETLFFEVAERIYAEVWALMNAAETDPGPFVHRLVLLLDAKVGHIKRLLMASPHAAELMDETRSSLASPALDALTKGFHEALDGLIAKAVADREIDLKRAKFTAADLTDALIAAAHGAVHTGPLDSPAFRRRLERHITLLVAGLAPR